MGAQSGVVTTIKILRAFAGRKMWRQADLTKIVGIKKESLKKHLEELASFRQLHAERQGSDWTMHGAPEGYFLSAGDLEAFVRLLTRAPASKLRDELVTLLANQGPRSARVNGTRTGALTRSEDRTLQLIEDCAAASQVMGMKYFSPSRGEQGSRNVSVHCVLPGPPVRFLAYCHTRNELRWFRAEHIAIAWPSPETTFVRVEQAVVDAKVQEGIHTYADSSEELSKFIVKSPDSRWVKNNLPPGMLSEDVEQGIRVTCPKGGLSHAARYVVGLGESAMAESAGLKAAVRRLAEGALKNHAAPASEPPASEKRKRTAKRKGTERMIAPTNGRPGSVAARG
jgi:predicted DNA-binding transcriptional regulator YafY